MAQTDLLDSGGYDDKHGFIRCPLCGGYAHHVVYETFEGRWAYCACNVEPCDDGYRVAGEHQCEDKSKDVEGKIQ